jgi:hypothetical protein
MPKTKTKGGLIDALWGQIGGADSYAWHRATSASGEANAKSHLSIKKKLPWEAKAQSGEEKRAAWIAEVRGVMDDTGSNWRDALKEASSRRKKDIPGYKTVIGRVTNGYTGRNADTVKCSAGKVCPGKYNKAPKTDPVTKQRVYRPNAHNVSRVHLTTDAAKDILRDYYKERANSGSVKGGLKGATRAMRQDISKRKQGKKVQSPCPTKLIDVNRKDGTSYKRRIVDTKHPDYGACRSNWLYRSNPGRFDMKTIDYGEGKASPAYGKATLPKTRKDKKSN